MKYIVAISGGVDSVVLLDMLARRKEHELVVAHFDHGIRHDSQKDAALVRRLAETYGCVYEQHEGNLGAHVSEAVAREARYAWLNTVMQKHEADAIVTAHHQDDVIETMIINIIRGTGWRGLCSLIEHKRLIRPLLSLSKAEITSYALDHGLQWREDSTNDDIRYLRNYVRYRYVQRLTGLQRDQWVSLYEAQRIVSEEINHEVEMIASEGSYQRYFMIMCGRKVAGELLAHSFGRMEKSTLDQLWHFVCTGRPGTCFIQGGRQYRLTTRELIVSSLYT